MNAALRARLARRRARGPARTRAARATSPARSSRPAEDAREPREVRDPLLHRARQRDEHGHARRRERLERGPRVLFLIRDHELRRERDHRVDIDVLRAADDPARSPPPAHAVASAPDEPIARAERDHAVRVARHQRHDPLRRPPDQQLATEVIADLHHRHRGYSTTAQLVSCAAMADKPPAPVEDPLVAQAFDATKHDELAAAIEQLTPDEAQFFLHKLESALRKRRLQIFGYLAAMFVWAVGMVIAFGAYALFEGGFGYALFFAAVPRGRRGALRLRQAGRTPSDLGRPPTAPPRHPRYSRCHAQVLARVRARAALPARSTSCNTEKPPGRTTARRQRAADARSRPLDRRDAAPGVHDDARHEHQRAQHRQGQRRRDARDVAAERSAGCSSSSSAAAIRIFDNEQLRRDARSSTSRAADRVVAERRAGPARPRVRSELRDEPPLLRLLHRRQPERETTPHNPYVDVIERYQVSAADPNVADPTSATVILAIEDPFVNHNGGMIEFGPDGDLYISIGDGGAGGDPQRNGQNPNALLGKMLRLDVAHPANGKQYGIPSDNPYANGASGAPEVFMLGLRNPWRWSFDRGTGDMWIGDVGQNQTEELDVLVAGKQNGKNLGWSAFEGSACCAMQTGNCARRATPFQPCDTTGKFFPQLDARTRPTAGTRSSAARSIAAPATPTSSARTSTPTTCHGPLRGALQRGRQRRSSTDLPGTWPSSPASIHADARGELYETDDRRRGLSHRGRALTDARSRSPSSSRPGLAYQRPRVGRGTAGDTTFVLVHGFSDLGRGVGAGRDAARRARPRRRAGSARSRRQRLDRRGRLLPLHGLRRGPRRGHRAARAPAARARRALDGRQRVRLLGRRAAERARRRSCCSRASARRIRAASTARRAPRAGSRRGAARAQQGAARWRRSTRRPRGCARTTRCSTPRPRCGSPRAGTREVAGGAGVEARSAAHDDGALPVPPRHRAVVLAARHVPRADDRRRRLAAEPRG